MALDEHAAPHDAPNGSESEEAAKGTMIRVEVAYAPEPRAVDLVALQLPRGSDVQAALLASGLLKRHGLSLDDVLNVGVWAKLRPLDHALREGDRVEIYRPLKVDPKEARRQRYKRQGPRGSRSAR